MYALILFFHVGIWGDTDSNATTVVPDFATHELCTAAGAEANKLVAGTKKEMAFICVKRGN